VVAALFSSPSPACIVCVADPLETVLVAELEGAAQVVVAVPLGDRDENRYRIETIYRGPATLKPGDELSAALPLFSTDGGKIGTEAVLITRRDDKADWTIRAPADREHLAFFESVLSLPKPGSMDVLDELNRAVFFAGHLHDEDAILAKAGAAELTRLPYPMLKKIRTRLDPVAIRSELKNPAAADRYALFYTLLGLCGNEEDAASIRRYTETMWKSNGWRNLGALLTARLELEGAAVVDEIVTRYIADENRTLPEIEQAILALRVHGDADDTVTRQRAVAAFRIMFDEREPLVFLIAGDLTRWEDWESKERLLELVERRGKDFPELRLRVDEFLVRCPR
jgi:hypothetical protein